MELRLCHQARSRRSLFMDLATSDQGIDLTMLMKRELGLLVQVVSWFGDSWRGQYVLLKISCCLDWV